MFPVFLADRCRRAIFRCLLNSLMSPSLYKESYVTPSILASSHSPSAFSCLHTIRMISRLAPGVDCRRYSQAYLLNSLKNKRPTLSPAFRRTQKEIMRAPPARQRGGSGNSRRYGTLPGAALTHRGADHPHTFPPGVRQTGKVKAAPSHGSLVSGLRDAPSRRTLPVIPTGVPVFRSGGPAATDCAAAPARQDRTAAGGKGYVKEHRHRIRAPACTSVEGFTRAGRHPRRGRGSLGRPPSPRFNPRWRVRLFPGPSSSARRFHPPPAGSSGLRCAAPLVCTAATTLPRPYGPLISGGDAAGLAEGLPDYPLSHAVKSLTARDRG